MWITFNISNKFIGFASEKMGIISKIYKTIESYAHFHMYGRI